MPSQGSQCLLIIDVQNDFCPGGALAVPGGDQVVEVVNRLGERFAHRILTQDWHPAGHLSFASSHPSRAPLETTTLPYGEQVLWPDHCVQGTPGAEFHPGLGVNGSELILRKGFRREIDSYSAFFENDRTTAHRPRRLPPRARLRAPLPLRPRHRLLRRLLRPRRPPRRLRGRGDRGRLPRHRHRRLPGHGVAADGGGGGGARQLGRAGVVPHKQVRGTTRARADTPAAASRDERPGTASGADFRPEGKKDPGFSIASTSGSTSISGQWKRPCEGCSTWTCARDSCSEKEKKRYPRSVRHHEASLDGHSVCSVP